jgi:hypothetical protein
MNIFKLIHEVNKIIWTKEQRKWLYIYTVLCAISEGFSVYALIQLFKKK